jgi:uncharacterized protein (DUF885 family)
LRLAGSGLQLQGGHNKWVELRQRAERELGPRFDLRAFHDILLEGSMPLTILEKRVGAWIQSRKA